MKCVNCGGKIRRASHVSDAVYEHVHKGFTLKHCDPFDPRNGDVAWPVERDGDGDGELETDGGGDSIVER